jgi:hypothetical protein
MVYASLSWYAERCIHHMQVLLEYRISWDMYTPYAGAAGMLYQLRDVYTIYRCCWNVVSTGRCIHHIQMLLECCINASSICIWCMHLSVDTTFQQHLHMVYTSLSWYDIPAAHAYGVFISQEMLYQLRDVYTICRCCWNVVSTERCIHHMQMLLECCINWEMYTPYAGAAGILIHINVKLTTNFNFYI